MKKICSLFLAVLFLLNTFAIVVSAESADEPDFDMEIPISEVDLPSEQYHNQIIAGHAKTVSTSTSNEYEILKMLENMSIDELTQRGYSADTIAAVESGQLDDIILETTFERASLSVGELSNMGYSDSEITVLKNLNGDETLEEISTYGILADCICYNTLVDHFYSTYTGKTYFIVSFGWEWDKCPVWLMTDCVGVGWNHNFHPDDSLDPYSDTDYNTIYKKYVNIDFSIGNKYTSKAMAEKQLNTCEDQFDMNGYYGPRYYVKGGWGTIALSQTGQQNDVKMSFKYGHNEAFASASVGYPWGVSFSIEGAESIFMPPEIVYSDYARVVNDIPIITLGVEE